MYLFFVCMRIWDNMNGQGEICGRQPLNLKKKIS